MISINREKCKDFFCSPSYFRIVCVLNLLFQSLVLFDAISCGIDGLLCLWAIYLFKKKGLCDGSFFKIENISLLMFFLFSGMITAFLHIGINFPVSFFFELGMLLYSAVCFFMFYGMHSNITKEDFEKETTLLFKTFVYINTILVFLSFLLILIKRQIVIEGQFLSNPPFKYIVGIYTVTGVQRFTGLYENPNIVAFCCVLSLIFIHMLISKKEFFTNCKKYKKIALFIFFCGINFLALMLSDSIASFLFLTIYVILVLFHKYISSSEHLSLQQKLKNLLIFFGNTSLVVLLLMFARQSLQESASSVISNISLDSSENPDIADVNFGRIAYSLGDGNGRLELLKQAFVIFKHHPILGCGFANIGYYGKLYFEKGLNFPNFHNGYASVLVCYGIIGFLPFFIFFVIIIRKLVETLLKNIGKRYLGIFPHCVAAVLAYLVYASSEKTMLSEVNIMGAFIWLVLGYAISYKKLYLDDDMFYN